MQRYEPGSPRALFGIFAVAITAATLALSVVAPAAVRYSAREIGVLAPTIDDAAPLRAAALNDAAPITSIDVVAVRTLRLVPVIEARSHTGTGLQG